jgi:hypothetical protein
MDGESGFINKRCGCVQASELSIVFIVFPERLEHYIESFKLDCIENEKILHEKEHYEQDDVNKDPFL